ncbi:hypothetical protein BDW67DRAFT_159597 [Aspergillus spinulosporus]
MGAESRWVKGRGFCCMIAVLFSAFHHNQCHTPCTAIWKAARLTFYLFLTTLFLVPKFWTVLIQSLGLQQHSELRST